MRYALCRCPYSWLDRFTMATLLPEEPLWFPPSQRASSGARFVSISLSGIWRAYDAPLLMARTHHKPAERRIRCASSDLLQRALVPGTDSQNRERIWRVLVEAYGMTEASHQITRNSAARHRKAGSVGVGHEQLVHRRHARIPGNPMLTNRAPERKRVELGGNHNGSSGKQSGHGGSDQAMNMEQRHNA